MKLKEQIKEVKNMSTLFINACVRNGSRTLELAEHLVKKIDGRIDRIDLEKEEIKPLDGKSLEERDLLLAKGEFENERFRYARQFAQAESIIVAAPFWDLGVPALLKIYLEAITAIGITFMYHNGVPTGLCRAKKLIYVTTAGGEMFVDFGYSYVKALAESFYGIKDSVCFKAENLDVIGTDVPAALDKVKNEMDGFSF